MTAKLETVPAPGPSSAPPEANFSIVCVSDVFWDEHWSSEQQISSRLAERCRVLYVDRPVSIFSGFTGTSDAPVTRQWLRWLRGGLRRESDNLTILTPAPLLPLRFNKTVNRINSWIRRRSIQRAIRKLGLENPVLWIYTPDAGRIVGTLGEAYSLYYCADDWSAPSYQWWNSTRDVRARELELAAKADLIVGTSTKIVKGWRDLHPNTMLMLNGADVDVFKQARDPRLEVPAELQKIPHPRIGYVGFVDSRFDTQLYARIASSRPDWQLIIVGPVMEQHVDLSVLKSMPNVHFLGPRLRPELPAFLKGFDVCTIPYVCSKLAESIFPLKLFEYLSAGRPVVSTGLPELAPYVQYVHVTDSPEAFEQAIEQSLTHPLPLASEAFLNENSWGAKAGLMWQTLSQSVRAGANRSGPA